MQTAAGGVPSTGTAWPVNCIVRIVPDGNYDVSVVIELLGAVQLQVTAEPLKPLQLDRGITLDRLLNAEEEDEIDDRAYGSSRDTNRSQNMWTGSSRRISLESALNESISRRASTIQAALMMLTSTTPDASLADLQAPATEPHPHLTPLPPPPSATRDALASPRRGRPASARGGRRMCTAAYGSAPTGSLSAHATTFAAETSVLPPKEDPPPAHVDGAGNARGAGSTGGANARKRGPLGVHTLRSQRPARLGRLPGRLLGLDAIQRTLYGMSTPSGVDLRWIATLEKEYRYHDVIGGEAALRGGRGEAAVAAAAAAQRAHLGDAFSVLALQHVRSSPGLAADCLHRAIELLPPHTVEHVTARRRLGVVHWLHGKPQRALAQLATAATMDSATGATARAHLRLLLCRVSWALGETDAALGWAHEADELLEVLLSQIAAATGGEGALGGGTGAADASATAPPRPLPHRPRRGHAPPPGRSPRSARDANQIAHGPALGLGVEPPPPPPVGRDHAPDKAVSATAGVLPLLQLRAIAKDSLRVCLAALGKDTAALAEGVQSQALATAACGGGSVLHAPVHVDELFVDVRLPSASGRLLMYRDELQLPLERWDHVQDRAARTHRRKRTAAQRDRDPSRTSSARSTPRSQARDCNPLSDDQLRWPIS